MLLKEIYTPDVVCCTPGTSLTIAAQLMRDRHVGDSVVVAPTGGTTVAVNSVFWIPVTNATAGTTVTVSVGITASSGNYVLNNGATEPTTLAALIF